MAAAPTPSRTQALKKPGAWRDHPLRSNTPAQPYYVRLPARIWVVNVSPAQLRAQIAQLPVVATPTGAQVTIPLAVATVRPALRDLTRAVLDRTLATLHTPTALAERVEHFVSPPRPADTLPTALAARIASGNERIGGNGTAEEPFTCRDPGLLYVSAPITLVFPGAQPQEVDLVAIHGFDRRP